MYCIIIELTFLADTQDESEFWCWILLWMNIVLIFRLQTLRIKELPGIGIQHRVGSSFLWWYTQVCCSASTPWHAIGKKYLHISFPKNKNGGGMITLLTVKHYYSLLPCLEHHYNALWYWLHSQGFPEVPEAKTTLQPPREVRIAIVKENCFSVMFVCLFILYPPLPPSHLIC